MAIQIGCGSWADAEYVNLLYPKGTASPQRLEWYAKHFEHTEVNASYYRTPRPEATTTWARQTPENFQFEVKLHRLFSISPEKSAQGNQMDYVLNGMEPLLKAGKLGALLLVADPRFRPEKNKLEAFDALVARMPAVPLAVELRHGDWVKGKQRDVTLDFFRERQITWVAVDMPKLTHDSILPTIAEVTNPKLAYLRLHGRNPKYLEAKSAEERHVHAYSEAELREIVRLIKKLEEKAERVCVVANNHAQDFAPKTALALKRLLKQELFELPAPVAKKSAARR